jgi:hypothetical protein
MTLFYPLSLHNFFLISHSPHITYSIMVPRTSKSKSVRSSALFTWKPATIYFPFSNSTRRKVPISTKKKPRSNLRLILIDLISKTPGSCGVYLYVGFPPFWDARGLLMILEILPTKPQTHKKFHEHRKVGRNQTACSKKTNNPSHLCAKIK